MVPPTTNSHSPFTLPWTTTPFTTPPKTKAKRKRNQLSLGNHACNVYARDQKHALSVARDQGLTLLRGSCAIHIGKEGYYRALRRAFNTPIAVQPVVLPKATAELAFHNLMSMS